VNIYAMDPRLSLYAGLTEQRGDGPSELPLFVPNLYTYARTHLYDEGKDKDALRGNEERLTRYGGRDALWGTRAWTSSRCTMDPLNYYAVVVCILVYEAST